MLRSAPARFRGLLGAAGLFLALGQSSAGPAAAASATTFSPTTVPLAPGQSVTVTIQVTGLAANVNGGQWAIVHPTDGSVTLTNASCTGIFGGAALLGPSAQPYGTLVACGFLTGTVSGSSGNALTFTLTRVSGTSTVPLSFQSTATYYTRNDGTVESGGQLGTLTVTPATTTTATPTATTTASPSPTPPASPTPPLPASPTPSPTALATATPTVPPGGSPTTVALSPIGGSGIAGSCTFTPVNGGTINAQCTLSGLSAPATVIVPLVGGGSASLACPGASGTVACGGVLPGSPQIGGSVTVTVGGTVVASGSVASGPPASPTSTPVSLPVGPAIGLPPLPPPLPLLPPAVPPPVLPAPVEMPPVPPPPLAGGGRAIAREVPVVPEASPLRLIAIGLAAAATWIGLARWRRGR